MIKQKKNKKKANARYMVVLVYTQHFPHKGENSTSYFSENKNFF